MIKDQTLDEAIVEAMRFVKAAKALRDSKRLGSDDEGDRARHGAVGHWTTVAEHAACKRASLDLTRKLADLRAGR